MVNKGLKTLRERLSYSKEKHFSEICKKIGFDIVFDKELKEVYNVVGYSRTGYEPDKVLQKIKNIEKFIQGNEFQDHYKYHLQDYFSNDNICLEQKESYKNSLEKEIKTLLQ